MLASRSARGRAQVERVRHDDAVTNDEAPDAQRLQHELLFAPRLRHVGEQNGTAEVDDVVGEAEAQVVAHR